MLDAVKFGHEKFVPIIEAIEKLAKKAGKPKWEVEEADHSETKKKIAEKFESDFLFFCNRMSHHVVLHCRTAKEPPQFVSAWTSEL